jgi:flavin reductase (DIM6/NTAB) family NADH-FMN oxidoreductase RutF
MGSKWRIDQVETENSKDATKPIRGREVSALLNPRPAVLVTCCDAEGKPNVFSLAWHTPLSHVPLLMGISVARAHLSHALIELTGEFVVNIVSTAYRDAVELCGQVSGRECDKLSLAGLSVEPARYVRPPLIAGALGTLECRVVHLLVCGDHTFFIGEVLAASARSECFGDAWQPSLGDVLLCLQRDRFGRFSKMEEP